MNKPDRRSNRPTRLLRHAGEAMPFDGVELLEPRQMLAVITWTAGAANDFWHTAGNWDLNRVPNATDDVLIPANAGSVNCTFNATSGTVSVRSISAAEGFVLSGGSLSTTSTAAGSADFGSLTISGGSLTVGATAGTGFSTSAVFFISSGSFTNLASRSQFDSLFSMSGGSLTTNIGLDLRHTASANSSSGGTFFGNGELDLGANVTLNYSGLTRIHNDLNISVNNLATLNWTAGTTTFDNDVGFFLNNGGTLNFNSGAGAQSIVQGIGSGSRMECNGVLTKAGTGTTTFGPEFHSASTSSIDITAGTLALSGGDGANTSNLSATVAAAATFALTGGAFEFNAGAAISGAGTASIAGATLTLGAALITTANVNVSAGLLNTNAQSPTYLLGLSGGVVTGTGTLTLAAGSTWSGGELAGSGGLVIPFGVTLPVSGAATKFLSRPTTIAGNFDWSAGDIDALASITITNVGNLRAMGAGILSDVTLNGTVMISSLGDIEKTGPGTTTTLDIRVEQTNDATADVIVTSGTLVLAKGGDHDGDFSVASGATLNFSGGTHTFQPGQSLSGAGTAIFSNVDTTAINLQSSAIANLTISGASVNFISGAFTATVFTLNAGSLFVAGSFAVQTLTMTDGLLSGPGSVTVNSGGAASSWSLGVIDLTAGLSVAGGAVMNISGDSGKAVGHLLSNSGTINWSGRGFLTLLGACLFDNLGSLNITATGSISSVANSGAQLRTQSLITATPDAAGTATINVIFNSAATALTTVTAGTLRFSSGGADAGDFKVNSTGTLELAGGTFSLAAGAAIDTDAGNDGAFKVTAGALTVTDPGTYEGRLFVSGSSTTVTFVADQTFNDIVMDGGTINGAGNLTILGVVGSTWGAGTMAGTGRTIYAPGPGAVGFTMGATATGATVRNLTRVFENRGTIAWSNLSVNVSGGLFANGIVGTPGFLNIIGVSKAISATGAAGELVNAPGSTVSINSPGNNQVFGAPGGNPCLTNNGTLNLVAGATFVDNGGTSAGTINISAGANLLVNSVFTCTPSSITNNLGTITGLSGVLHLAGGSSGAVINVMAGGEVDFDAGFTHSSGSLITGAGSIRFNAGTHSVPLNSFNPTGAVNFAGGTVTINNSFVASSIAPIAGVITFNAAFVVPPSLTITGTANFNAPITLNAVTLSGTLGGSATTSIGGLLTVSGTTAAMNGAGQTIMLNGSGTSLPLGTQLTLSRAFETRSNFTLAGTLRMSGSPVTNAAGAFITMQGSGSILTSGAPGTPSGTFTNSGALIVMGNGSAIESGITLAGTGLISITSPAGLTLRTGGSYAGAVTIASPGGILSINTNPFTFAAGGTLDIGFALIADANVTLAGTTTINGTNNPGITRSVSMTTVVTLTGTLNFQSSGIFAQVASFVIAPSGILNLNGSFIRTVAVPLTNNGTINANAGTLKPLTTLSNALGGVINAEGATTFDGSGGVILLSNVGTFNKNGTGTATFTNGLRLSNVGVVNVNQGTLSLLSTGHVSGGTFSGAEYNIAAGAGLNLNANVSTLDARVRVLGSGASIPALATLTQINAPASLTLAGGFDLTLTAAAQLVNNGLLRLGAGSILTTTGGFRQAASGQLFVDINSTNPATGQGRIACTGAVNLGGSLSASFVDGFVPAVGDTFDVVTSVAGVAGQFATVTITPPGPLVAAALEYLPGSATIRITDARDPRDFNGDGTVDPDDLADFIGAYFAIPPDSRADFNGDGEINPDDLADFIGAYFS